MALIAYERPELSPLGHLMGPSEASRVAGEAPENFTFLQNSHCRHNCSETNMLAPPQTS